MDNKTLNYCETILKMTSENYKIICYYRNDSTDVIEILFRYTGLRIDNEKLAWEEVRTPHQLM